MIRRAFDLGITHFDLANNYGPPPGSAEETFGKILRQDLAAYRDELVISTKAGYRMWPGPYGEWGSRKYLIASLDQSLQRMGLDYVDIYLQPPLRPGHAAGRDHDGAGPRRAPGQGALRRHLVLPAGADTRRPSHILRELGTPCLIHQPAYSMFRRWVEDGLLDVLTEEGIGCIAFSPLAQGLLTSKYLAGVPEDSRAAKQHGFLQARPGQRGEHRQGAAAERDRPGARPDAWRRWRSRGCCAIRHDVRTGGRQPRQPDRGQRRRAGQPGLLRKNSPRSTICWQAGGLDAVCRALD